MFIGRTLLSQRFLQFLMDNSHTMMKIVTDIIGGPAKVEKPLLLKGLCILMKKSFGEMLLLLLVESKSIVLSNSHVLLFHNFLQVWHSKVCFMADNVELKF